MDIPGTRDVPYLSLQEWCDGEAHRGVLHYDETEHQELPHVVKFSGGRSSGLMLLLLLANDLLDPERGDVVLFTNTSAEHPATYDFVRKMKGVTERCGIPFFLAQLQTIETVVGGEWRRRLTYRLTNHRPLTDKNPDGYCHRGEVFQEAVSFNGMLPSVHTRICTTLMKMFVTREFLSDWFANRAELPEIGHKATGSKLDTHHLYQMHRASRGTMSREEFENRLQFISSRPTYRPLQRMANFTKAPLPDQPNELLRDSIFGDRCYLFGTTPAPYITFLGFRSGENARYYRMVQRNLGERTPGQDTQPPGEHSYAPLFNLGIDQDQVLEFWRKQHGRIRPHLPENLNLSNCVFCFLKGRRKLQAIHNQKSEFERDLPEGLRAECRKRKTPNGLAWWEQLEDTYKRKANRQSDDGANSFGMFGLKSMSYRSLREESGNGRARKQTDSLDLADTEAVTCECTD